MSGSPQVQLGHRVPRADGTDDGVFAGWSWEERCLMVRNDRLGFFPLYHFTTRDQVAVSPSILRLLEVGAPAKLDLDALAVMVRTGHFVGNDTAFRAIRAFGPRTRFSWPPAAEEPLEDVPATAGWSGSRSAAIDAYVERFRGAMARRPPSDQGFDLALSGGHDSRHILLELLAQGHRPRTCVTTRHIPPRDDQDATIATRLTARLGVPHVILDSARSQLAAERRKNQELGFGTDLHAWFLTVADHFRSRGSAFYDGLGGGTLSAGVMLDRERLELAERGRWRELALRIFRPRERALPWFLTERAQRALSRERALARIVRELERHGNAPNPLGSYVLADRARRGTALMTFGLMADLPVLQAPFLDRDITDHMLSLPASMTVGHDFHAQAIARAFPQHAALPFPVKPGRRSDPAHGKRLARDVAGFALRHGTGLLIDRARLLRRLAWHALDGDLAALERLQVPLIVDLMQLEGVVAAG